MGPNRSDRILQEWAAVARSAATPRHAPRRAAVRGAGAGINLVGALAVALVLVVAIAWLGNREGLTGPGSIPSATPPVTVPPDATPSTTVTETPSPTLTSRPSIIPTCETGELVAQITMWDGAAGSRIATVVMSNTGSAPCTTRSVVRVRLIDGSGTELIEGAAASGEASITIPASGSVTTLVQASNYCGSDPVPGVGIAFDIDGVATVVTKSASPTDATVPPCNGPGQPGSIKMQPWQG